MEWQEEWANKVADLIRHDNPHLFWADTTTEVLMECAYIYMGLEGLSLYPSNYKECDMEITIESLQQNYEKHGEIAIIRDGKLLGFKKEAS